MSALVLGGRYELQLSYLILHIRTPEYLSTLPPRISMFEVVQSKHTYRENTATFAY
jgi:hypothetical protein